MFSGYFKQNYILMRAAPALEAAISNLAAEHWRIYFHAFGALALFHIQFCGSVFQLGKPQEPQPLGQLGKCALNFVSHKTHENQILKGHKVWVWRPPVVRGKYTRYAGYVCYAGCVTDTLMVWFMWKHSYEARQWCGVSIRGMQGMCAMLDVSHNISNYLHAAIVNIFSF